MHDDISSAARVADHLAAEVAALAPGARLPSQRVLVARYSVSASTIAHAVSLLVQRGLVESRPGSGAFRSHRPTTPPRGDTTWQGAALAITESLESGPTTAREFTAAGLAGTLNRYDSDVVDLNGGYLHPSLRPEALLSASLSRVARRTEAWDRPPAGGLASLRDWFAHDIGPGLSRNDILIAPGGQAALSTTLRALTQPGDSVILESPTYPGTIAAAHAASLRCVPVPLDHEGIIPAHLDEALGRSRARIVVAQPAHQNPTGATMSTQRRGQLRQVARHHHAFLVEDDYARYLTHADAPTPASPLVLDDPDGTVIHVRSLTKATSPNLRVAAIAARGPVTTRLRDALTIDALLVPTALQMTAHETVTAPGWRRAQAELGRQLHHRRTLATTTVLRELGPGVLDSHSTGGYHLWLDLTGQPDLDDPAAAALSHGVAITPGSNYYPPGTAHPPHLRLSYVAAPTATDLEHGIQRLVHALRPHTGAPT